MSALALVALLTAARAAPTCDATKTVANGTLCAIKPSLTDPYTTNGFGDHVVGLPAHPTKGIWVHLSGAGGSPYYTRSKRWLNETWIGELMGQGYTVLDLAYDNSESVTESCSTDSGRALDHCAGNVRLEVLTGANVSPLRNTSTVNSVEHRTAALVDYLGLGPWEGWPSVSLSGHSQGAGMAYYIAKFYGVRFGCFLAGPYDVADYVPGPLKRSQNIADWYLDTTADETPAMRMGAFLTTADGAYRSFTKAFDLIGLTEGHEWFEADKASYADADGKRLDGHAAAVQDPSLASRRAQACFRD